MLNVKIVLKTPITNKGMDLRSPLASESPVTRLPPPASPSPSGGSTDARTFKVMQARRRRAQARARLVKRLSFVALLGAAAAFHFWWRPRLTPPVATATATATATEMAVPVAPVPPTAVTADPAPPAAIPAVAPLPASPATPLPPAAPLQFGPTEESPTAPASTPAPPAAPALEPAAAANSTDRRGLCQQEFAAGRWRSAIEHCQQAFADRPDATLALNLAHSHYARGQVASAGRWASRAVVLKTRDADAFVLIGHAERQAGHHKQAVRAYRRYLRESPRGWHARNVKAALRTLRAKAMSEAAALLVPPPLGLLVQR